MNDIPKLGKIIEDKNPKRDAVHVAVVPMLAVRDMYPGEHLGSGIVDPFLKENVLKGQWFWFCLFPGTVTSLRHVWSHPNFVEEK